VRRHFSGAARRISPGTDEHANDRHDGGAAENGHRTAADATAPCRRENGVE
jgi:hypothetical protein